MTEDEKNILKDKISKFLSDKTYVKSGTLCGRYGKSRNAVCAILRELGWTPYQAATGASWKAPKAIPRSGGIDETAKDEERKAFYKMILRNKPYWRPTHPKTKKEFARLFTQEHKTKAPQLTTVERK